MALLLPLLYFAQYLAGAGVMHVWSELLHRSEGSALLLAVALTIPLAYGLSKRVFARPVKLSPWDRLMFLSPKCLAQLSTFAARTTGAAA